MTPEPVNNTYKLTPEQIAAMTHAELRMEIAQRLGWTTDGNLWAKNDGAHLVVSLRGLPDWITDISAAWELAEGTKWNYDILKKHDPLDGKPDYSCSIWVEGINADDKQITIQHRAYSDTAPLAICRAWLAWKEAQ